MLEISRSICWKTLLPGELAQAGTAWHSDRACKTLPLVWWLVDLASRSRRRLMIRLVKGATGIARIKRAQMEGLEDIRFYTRKV